MEQITQPQEMQQIAFRLRAEGKTIGCVPTMGCFHEGHLSLMREARKRCDVLQVSIFVNPPQFGPGEDLEKYPRDMERDVHLAEEIEVDYLFVPSVEEMYPESYSTYVEVEGMTETLCGKARPGHFKGVATVVVKLLTIMMPHFAFFGQKDGQQLAVIKRLVRDLNLPVAVVGLPIVREADGLPMSTRNEYLGPEEREHATVLNKALSYARGMILSGERDAARIAGESRMRVASEPGVEVEYFEVVSTESMQPVSEIDGEVMIATAARVGPARLIDNLLVRCNGDEVEFPDSL